MLKNQLAGKYLSINYEINEVEFILDVVSFFNVIQHVKQFLKQLIINSLIIITCPIMMYDLIVVMFFFIFI